jgi:hypothetical protein
LEGDTLVVDTTNLNGNAWLSMEGGFTSRTLTVVERCRLIDAYTLRYEATLTDSKVYTRRWTMAFTMARRRESDYEIIEHACHEGNKPPQVIPGVK